MYIQCLHGQARLYVQQLQSSAITCSRQHHRPYPTAHPPRAEPHPRATRCDSAGTGQQGVRMHGHQPAANAVRAGGCSKGPRLVAITISNCAPPLHCACHSSPSDLAGGLPRQPRQAPPRRETARVARKTWVRQAPRVIVACYIADFGAASICTVYLDTVRGGLVSAGIVHG